ncbi:hypothetical protein ACLB2K_026537 [Fragaria x ananassa]
MDDGDGADHMNQFHRNEAISAVADDGFLAEEDDDYEDLYNDVNVGEGFYQSMRKNEAAVTEEKKADLPEVSAAQLHQGAPIPSSGGGAGFGNQNLGFRGKELKGPVGGGGGMRIELGQGLSKLNEVEQQSGAQGMGAQQQQLQPQPQPPQQQLHGGGGAGNVGNEGFLRQPGGVGGGNVNGVGGNSGSGGGFGGGAAGGATLYVGDLHWWTTDAELEAELCKYGQVKEVKFYEEKASGKSKGYCQVDFYDSAAAMACKEGMHGHLFNGRPCVVAITTPYSVKRMGEAQVNRNQQVSQTAQAQPRRGPNDAAGNKAGGSAITTGGNYQGGDNNNRGYGRANWGRGNSQGMGGRGPGGPMRNRGGMSGRGIMGNGGNGFGQGIGATPPLMHPQSMMGQGFDPAFGAPMGRMGSYGGFPGAPQPPFSGMMSSFPPVGGVGLPGVAPHVNPAFFGRGIPMSGNCGMGMMPTAGVDGPNMGMWPDPSMGGGWPGEEHGGGRAGESSYGEEAGSDHQYGEASHDRGGWQSTMKEKDRGSERDWSGSSDRRYREDRDQGFDRDMPREKDVGHDHEWTERRHRNDVDVNRERDRERDRGRERSRDRDRERYREERERYADHHKYRDREMAHQDETERGRSTRTHSKARLPEDDDRRSRSRDRRSRSRDVDYGKRRRLTSE